MSRRVYDEPSQVSPIEGEVAVHGPGTTGMSITPDAARETARRLEAAASRADQGHDEDIDLDDSACVARWAQRLGVSVEAIRNAVIAVGPASDAVALRLKSARGAAD
ncbi:hypothetical protein BH10PSE3_BH10PSE3_04300 [soil metagenome]